MGGAFGRILFGFEGFMRSGSEEKTHSPELQLESLIIRDISKAIVPRHPKKINNENT